MKTVFFLIMSALSLSTMSCNQQTHSHEQTGEASVFACPMKCEGDKTYDAPGTCPVCKMALKPVSGAAAEVDYVMNMALTPPVAGEPATFAFTPKIRGNDAAPVPLDEVHEKKLHLIIVSQDLSWYDHVHPEYQPDGSYALEQTFPAGGPYIIFADYQPTGAGNQVERFVIQVSGPPAAPQNFTTESLLTQTDGYTVRLVPTGGKFLTNNMNHMGVEVSENGKPVTEFENIMGAKGHLVVISGDGENYIHVHPDEVEGKLDLHAQFDKPGIYRAYFQFQTKGRLHTSYFTLDVKEGKAGELGTDADHGHEH